MRALLACEDGEAIQALGHVGAQLEALTQSSRAVAEVAFAGGDLRGLRLELGGVRVPRGGGRIEIGQIPAVGLGLGVGRCKSERSDEQCSEASAHERLRKIEWRNSRSRGAG